jgi:hypothetical protein
MNILLSCDCQYCEDKYWYTLPASFSFCTDQWMKSLQSLSSSHNISFFISHQLFLLMLMSSSTWLNLLVLVFPISLCPLNFNSNALHSILLFFFQWPSIWGHLTHEESCIPIQFCNVTSCLCWINFVLVQAIMCCSFSIIQEACVEISTDASNFTPSSQYPCPVHSFYISRPFWLREKICDYTGLCSLFSFLQFISSHSNSPCSELPQYLLTAGRLRTQTAPPGYSTWQLEQHAAVQQFQPQGSSVIDPTGSGEINLIWCDHIGHKVYTLVDSGQHVEMVRVFLISSLLSAISK